MKPIKFKQANADLAPPSDWDMPQPCWSLPVYRDGKTCLSCWRPTWRERLTILLTGRVWLWVVGGHTQPPVALDGESPWS